MSSSSPDAPALPHVAVSFTLLRSEFLRAARRSMLAAAWLRVSVTLGIGVLVVGIVTHSLFSLVWGVLYPLAIAATVVAYPAGIWRLREHLRGEQLVELSDEHVTIKTVLARSTLEWRYWDAAALKGQLYQLTSDKGGGLLVPRRAFSTPQQEEDFRVLLRRHLGAKFTDA
jgi:hypothetical protein